MSTTDELKQAGEAAFAEIKLSFNSVLASTVPDVVAAGVGYLARAEKRFAEIMAFILSGELGGKDAVQFFTNRMDDEKNILFGLFLSLEVLVKSDIETIANSVQLILLKSANTFLNSISI